MLKPSPKYLVTMGDSLTDNATLRVLPHYLWPALLSAKMRAVGVDVYERNWAKNGSRTDQQLALMPLMTKYGTPDFGILWGGANDQVALAVSSITSAGLVATVTTAANHGLQPNTWIVISGANEANYNITARVVTVPNGNTFTYALLAGAASPATTATAITWNIPIAGTRENLAAMVKWLEFGCKGVVLNETALPVANVGDRYIVLVDGSATGGIEAPINQGLTPLLGGAGNNAQTVWECRYSLGSPNVWGRIATAVTPADRCKKIILGGAQYLNYAANAGDNVNVSTGKRFVEASSNDDVQAGIYYGVYQTLRAAQLATATAEGVVFCDTFDFFSRKIAAGFHTQGSAAEHVAAGNQHHNRYGHSLLAEAYFEAAKAAAFF